VSLDDLQEKLAEFEDYVQSSDVAAMQSKRWRFHCVEHESDCIPSEL
jgi:elongation factor 1-beta